MNILSNLTDRVLSAVLIGCWTLSAAAPIEPTTSLEWRHPIPTANNLRAVISIPSESETGMGHWIAVGDRGTVLLSTNGGDWAQADVPSEASAVDWFGIAYREGRTVIVGTGTVLIRDDLGWRFRVLDRSLRVRAVAPTPAGRGFVAVGASAGDGDGWIYLSNDGTNWERILFWEEELTSVASWIDNASLVAVGAKGTILTSPDGRSWTAQRGPIKATLSAIARLPLDHAKTAYFAVGSAPFPPRLHSSVLLTSGDGLDWTVVDSGATEFLYGVAGTGEGRVAVGGGGIILTSIGGAPWSLQRTALHRTLNAVAAGSSGFVAVGNAGTILHSTNLMTWTSANSGNPRHLADVTHGNGVYVAVGGFFTNAVPGATADRSTVLVSSNGLDWVAPANLPQVAFYSVAFGNGIFVATGADNGKFPLVPVIYTSVDGQRWTSRSGAISGVHPLWGVAYGNGRFIAVAENGLPEPKTKAYTSTNGTQWTRIELPTRYDTVAVAHGNDRFVAIGHGGHMLRSSDGLSWEAVGSGTTAYLRDVTFGGGLFVVVGANGTILTSPDGAQWTRRESGTRVFLLGVTHGRDSFAACGDDGVVLVSADAVTWTPKASGTHRRLKSLVFGPEALVVVGDGGTILAARFSLPAQGSLVPTVRPHLAAMEPPGTDSVDAPELPMDQAKSNALPREALAPSHSRSRLLPLTGEMPTGDHTSDSAPSLHALGAAEPRVHRLNPPIVLPGLGVRIEAAGTNAAIFRNYLDLYPIEASTDFDRWELLGLLVRTNRAGVPFPSWLDAEGAIRSHRFFRTPAEPFGTPIPPPTGPHRIGTLVRKVENPSNPLRKAFMVSVWYPAVPEAGVPLSRYMDEKNAALWDRALGRSVSLSPVSRSYAFPGAAAADSPRPFPVILHSAGQGDVRTDNVDKFELLASHGFVVVTLDSPQSQSWVMEDGELGFGELYEPLSMDYASRLGDVRFLADEIARWNLDDSILAGRLDTDRVGVFGFSFGGAVATGACQVDPRFKAGVSLDGGGHPDMAGVVMDVPFMFQVVVTDDNPYLTQPRKDNRALFDRMNRAGYFVRYRNASHGMFAELPWFRSPIDATAQRIGHSVRAYLLSFFNKHLRGVDDHMLDQHSGAHPDVETFLTK